ncbi:serine threonine specific protein phosphatase, partial [Cystoisospora suis]
MIIRFSVIAFVPPNAQLGVVGSAPFLGEWRVEHCVPLIPYSSPHPNGLEPSLWFRDIDISSLLPSSSSSSFHGESDPRHLHSANQQKASTDGGYTSTEEEEMRRTRRREDSCRKREDHEEGEKGGKREAGGYSSDEDLSSPSSSSSSERHRRSSSPCSSSPRRDCPFAVELLSVSRRLSSSCSSSTGNRGRGSKPRSHSSSGVCKTSHLPPPSAYNATNNSKTFSPYAHRDGRRQREGREEAEEDYSHGLPSRIPANSSSSSAGSSSSSNNVHPPGATCTTRRNGPCPNSTHSRGEEDYNKKRCGEEKSEGRKGGARERYMTSSSSSSLAGGGESPHSRRRRRKDRGERIQGRREGWEGVHRSVFYHIPTRDPKIQAILGKHPLKNFSFDYKFILWYPLESPPLPYCVTTMGDPDNISGVYTGAGGDDEDTDEDEEKERHWRKWLFPPIPARQPTPPKPGDHVIWEGYGPDSNRKFSFDPYDIVVDVNELGNL